jgi:Mg-chelatase subunit ChlD
MDVQNKVVPKEKLVKTADNVIMLVDTSDSMAALNKAHKKSCCELEMEALKIGA